MTDLPPGRELDALVAEKVMRWHLTGSDDDGYYWRNEKGHCQHPHEEWSPSTDWRAAGEVMAQFKIWSITVAGSLAAAVVRTPGMEHTTDGDHEAASLDGPLHAFCIAALAASDPAKDK